MSVHNSHPPRRMSNARGLELRLDICRLCTRCRRRRVTLWSRPEPAIGFEPMAKTDVRYWQKRVFFPECTRDGDKKGTKEWRSGCNTLVGGRRFNLAPRTRRRPPRRWTFDAGTRFYEEAVQNVAGRRKYVPGHRKTTIVTLFEW
jgi:hypothetical protein